MPTHDNKSFEERVKEYYRRKSEMDVLAADLEAEKAYLKKHVMRFGEEDEDSGHKTAIISAPRGAKYEVKNTLRVTYSLSAIAIDVIKDKLPALESKLIRTVETVNIDLIKKYIRQGKISPEIAKKILVKSENYSFQINIV